LPGLRRHGGWCVQPGETRSGLCVLAPPDSRRGRHGKLVDGPRSPYVRHLDFMPNSPVKNNIYSGRAPRRIASSPAQRVKEYQQTAMTVARIVDGAARRRLRTLLSIEEIPDNAHPSSPTLLPRGEGRFAAQMDRHPFMQNSIKGAK
jgi:hypothetical protein